MDYALIVSRYVASTLGLVFCLALSSPAQAQPVLFGGTSGDSGGELGTVNQANADFTLIGDPTANGPLVAIAINSAGEMFGSNNAGGSSMGSRGVLIRINPATGQLLDTVGPIVDSADQLGLTVTDFTFQPGTDILFGITSSSGDSKEGNLYTIDTTTGIATLVGETGLERGGLAFAPDGTLYLATVGDGDPPVIAQINPASAAVIGTPQTMTDGMDGLAVRPTDGVIFGTEADSDDLDTIDPTNGALTFIGSDDADDFLASLTFGPPRAGVAPVPALSQIGLVALMVALLAGGSIVLARRSRRT